MKDKNGCCGCPAQCVKSNRHGRCQAREEFEQQAKPKRKTFMEKMLETTTPEQIEEARRKAWERSQRNRNRSKGRGRQLTR